MKAKPEGKVIDCRSDEGKIIGLIDSILTISEILNERLSDQNAIMTDGIKEALKDMHDSRAIKQLTIKAFVATGKTIVIAKNNSVKVIEPNAPLS